MNRIISLFLFIFIASCLNGQYNSPIKNKVTLGVQTTADGLVFRGVASIDTVTATSKITRANKQDTSAYLLLDTVTNLLWHYKIGSNAWIQAGGSTLDTATMLLPYYRAGRNTIIQAADVPTLNQNTTGSAATLTTGRTIQTNLASTSATTFNGSANITPGVMGVLPLANGGTGQTTLAAAGIVTGTGTTNYIPKFTGTSAIGNSAITDDGTTLSYGSNIASIGATNTSEKYLQFNFTAGNFFVGGTNAVHYIYGAGSKPITFFTNSEERMRLNASGNLGLGVTPSNAYADSRTFEIGANGILWSEASSSIYNSLSIGLNFYYNAGGTTVYKNSSIASSRYMQYQGSHQWHTAPSGTAGTAISFTQAMTLDASGRLGIGVINPTGKLHSYIGDITAGNAPASSGTTPVNAMLNLTNNRGVGMYFGGSYSGTYAQWIQVADVGNLGVYYPLALNPNGGNVGIGATSPSATLEVVFPTQQTDIQSATQALTLINSSTDVSGNLTGLRLRQQNGTNAGNGFFGLSSGGSTATRANMIFAPPNSSGDATERMRITSGGNVGIGTSNPNVYGNGFTNQFTVSTTSSYANISVAGSSGNSGGIDFGNQSVRHAGVYGLDGSNLGFYTNGFNSGSGITERMRITSGGNVGIGTSSPAKQLDVYSSANSNTAQIVVSDASSTNRLYLGTFSNASYISFGGTYQSGWSANGTNAIANIGMSATSGASTIAFETSSTNGAGPTERMRITSGGEVWIGYTTNNGAYPLQVNGQIFATNATIATSDEKFKENITPLNKGLEIVNKLKPVTFNFISDTENNFSEYEEVGFIAQDIDRALSTETFAKSIVKAADDSEPTSTMGLATQNLIPILVKAIQEQNALIKALEQRILNLENK